MTRFILAEKITRAIEKIDSLGIGADLAVVVSDYFINMDPEKIAAIANIDAGLVRRLAQLTYHAGPDK